MNITEHICKDIDIGNTANNLDQQLHKDLPSPLPNYSGFNMAIAGSSGSGKTTLMYSIMTKRKKKGKRQSYRGVFDHIYIVSPTLGNKSMKKDEFAKLPQDQIHRELKLETLAELSDTFDKNRDEDEHSVLILDDVGSQLRKSQAIEKKLVQLCQNRRHLFLSVIFIIQKWKDLPTGIRNNLSHAAFFRPKNMPERESIMMELFPFKKNETESIFDYVYEKEAEKDRYSFLFVDMSLKKTSKYRYFKCFNELEISPKE